MVSWSYIGYSRFWGEYQIYFMECVENSDVSNSQDEIYLVITTINVFLFYTYRLHAMSHPLKKEVPKM